MTRNWANKFQDRWFVRVDGKGIPVYGSLIPRTEKPRHGRWIDVTACIPNQICCPTPVPPDNPTVSADGTGTFTETTGTTTYTLSNTEGPIATVQVTNEETQNATTSNLLDILNAGFSGLGNFSSTTEGSDTIFNLLTPIYPDLTATLVFT